MRNTIFILLCGFLLFELGASTFESQFAHAVDSANDEKKADPIEEKRLNRFMREKLTSSQLVLEGLMTEDYAMMQKGAEKMIKMSNATDWQVIEGPIFAQQSNEFRSAARQVIKFAKEKNLDGASLSYLHLTMTCISCHKNVNKVLLSQK